MQEKDYKTILDKIKLDAIENHVPILQDMSLEFIKLLLKLKKPARILEIGTAVGYSAINFSKYLEGKNSKLVTIERNEARYNKAIENIKNMDLESKIEVVFKDAVEYLETMDINDKFDVIFIDAAKGQYPRFLDKALTLINKDGVIIADNVLFKGRVMSGYNEHRNRTAVNRLRSFIEVISTDERLDTQIFDIGDGISVSIFKG